MRQLIGRKVNRTRHAKKRKEMILTRFLLKIAAILNDLILIA